MPTATKERKLTLNMPPLHPSQDRVRRKAARFNVLSCGRRWGKTTLCSALSIETAAKGDLAWWVAPTGDASRIGWNMMRFLANQIPGTKALKSEGEIQLATGGRMVIRSAAGDRSLRGEGIDRLIIEDAAMMKEDVWIADLRPALTDTLGDVWFPGTPRGRDWFYGLYQRGQDPDYPDWRSWQFPTIDNPIINPAEIEQVRSELPRWAFEQEYEAKFVSFAGRVYQTFDPVRDHVFDVPRDEYDDYWGCIDFGYRNPTAIGVFGEYDGGLDGLAEVYESGLIEDQIIAHVKALQEQYPVRRYWADPSEPAIIRAMRTAGLPVYPARKAKKGLSGESFVLNGILEVEKLLVADPPALRFSRTRMPNFIREMDLYRYPEARGERSAREAPLKIDDHCPDAVRYLVTSWQLFRNRGSGILI